MTTPPIKKILLLRFSSLGDIIMATAMIRCVRKQFPQAQIDMVVRGDFFDLIKHNPHLNNKWGLDRKQGIGGLKSLIRQINEEHYDLIYDAHRSLRTIFLMPFLKAAHKAYYKKHYVRRSLALTFKLRLLSRRRMLEKYIDPLVPYGVRYDGLGPEMWEAPGLWESSLKERFDELPKPWVGLIPSAQWPGKRWDPSEFRKLLQLGVEKTKFHFLIFGGKDDLFCADIAEGFSADRVTNLQGKLNLLEVTSLLKRAAFVVANDTGLMHVADAVNVPSVLIMGPTSAEMGCLPFHPHSQIVERNLWCRPCSKNGQAPCIRKERYCLTTITPLEVFEATMRTANALGLKS